MLQLPKKVQIDPNSALETIPNFRVVQLRHVDNRSNLTSDKCPDVGR